MMELKRNLSAVEKPHASMSQPKVRCPFLKLFQTEHPNLVLNLYAAGFLKKYLQQV